MSEQRANVRRLSNGCYLCRTQAGFRKAIKAYFDDHELQKPCEIMGYPSKYPSVVRFSFVYGWNEPRADCTPLNEYKAHIKKVLSELLDDLESEDEA